MNEYPDFKFFKNHDFLRTLNTKNIDFLFHPLALFFLI